MTRLLDFLSRPITASVMIIGLVFGYSSPAAAAKTIYKCTKDGQVTLTDKPCDSPTSPDGSAPSSATGATTIASSSDPSPVGDWLGQMQYQGRENGRELEEAHSVVLLTATFTPEGKVSATSAENGCKWLGVWSQGGRIISIDMSLTHCTYTDLNRRFTGTFLLGVPDSSGQVMLQAFTIPFPGRAVRGYDTKGTLRRN